MAPAVKKTNDILKKENILFALLIADDFELGFGVLEEDEPKILIPTVNSPVLDYTLEFLHASGIQEVVLFCCSHASKIKEYVNKFKSSNPTEGMTITVVISETCMSVGDAIRDVYDKRLLTDDFILIVGGVVSNIPMKPLIDRHKELKKKDKSTVMTTLFSRHSLSRGRRNVRTTAIAFLEDSNRIVFLQQNQGSNSKVSVPLDVFLDNHNVNVCCDLIDCQISICSPEVLSLFADNFDYQTRNDFIKGVLVHEEVLGNSVYLHIVEDHYAASVNDLPAYKAVSRDIISRWVVPIAPELMLKFSSVIYKQLRHNIYKHSDALVKGCQLISDVVVGKKSTLGLNCVVTGTVIGNDCEIGSNVYLKDAFIWDGVKIGSNCNIESAIIAYNARIGDDVKIYNSVLGRETTVESKSVIENCFKSSTDETRDADEEDHDSEDGNAVADPWYLNSLSDDYSSSEDQNLDSDGEDVGRRSSPELDDTMLFHRELRDTLLRGLEEKITCDKLILEINSLKYAYNVTVTEVNHLLMKAVLDISQITSNPKEKLSHLKQLLKGFLGIFINYMKSQESQTDLLDSIKEYTIGNVNFISTIANVVHFLYENDVLSEEVILNWYNDSLSDIDEYEKEIKSKISPLIKWLEEAEEEEESD
ncbi:hypothetical protein CHUAL_013999 [Chamberlinius hualienensis]